MKRIIFLFILTISFTACDKVIDIVEYNTNANVEEGGEEEEPQEFTWKGTWDGTLTNKEDKTQKYGYTLVITKDTEGVIEGTLKISNLPEKTDYIIYSLNIKHRGNVLIVRTLNKIKEEGSITFCNKNTFNLVLSRDKKSLSGFGKHIGCSITDSKINIEKK